MSNDRAANPKDTAVESLRHLAAERDEPHAADADTGVAAVPENAAPPRAAAGDAEARLAQIEIQTRVLAEAVLAIADTTKLGPAIQAVKNEM